MSWNAIVIGVDASVESARAAALAERLGRLANAPCHAIHAVRDEWAPLAAVAGLGEVGDLEEMRRLHRAVARHRVQEALGEQVTGTLLDQLEVRVGPAPLVIQQAADEHDAGLIVVGGKHHTTLDRWLGGSTNLGIVRAATRPVLITTQPGDIRRILVAADLSEAAGPTLVLAERLARLVGAKLRVISVFEPLPELAGTPAVDPTGYYELSQELLERDIWPRVRGANVDKIVRHGHVVETLPREAADWGADLLVLGSHGKGWAQRILLGSVTERLINDLPLSLLIAPVAAAALPVMEKAAVAAAV